MKVSFENIEQFAFPLSEHPLKWMFEDENHQISPEFSDQIIPLDSKATKFLCDFESSQRIFNREFFNGEYFKSNEEYITVDKTEQEVKKWLYQRGIPFDKKVFWTGDYCGSCILTWKMVIKFSSYLFNSGSDRIIWDETLNWGLYYFHHDVLYFGKHRIYSIEDEHIKIVEKQEELEEIQKIIEENKLLPLRKKYLKNPYLS